MQIDASQLDAIYLFWCDIFLRANYLNIIEINVYLNKPADHLFATFSM